MDEEIDYGSMTCLELVRLFFPQADEALCEFLLWEKTTFPFAEPDEIARQLRELVEKTKSGKRTEVGER